MHRTDVAIIGAGQAGLAMSACLQARGIAHVVLERGRVAESWRSARWDSLRLLTPNWMTRLPGHRYTGPDPDGFMHRDALVRMLAGVRRCRSCADPRRCGRARGDGGGRRLPGGDRPRQLVGAVAGGGDGRQPAATAACLRRGAAEAHPAGGCRRRYRRAGDLPVGGVLVVGASTSGLQLAQEIHASGRAVTLAVGRHTRMPRRYRGRDIFAWLEAAGITRESWRRTPDIAAARRQPSMQLSGNGPIDLARLAAAGVRVVGRVAGRRRRAAGARRQPCGRLRHLGCTPRPGAAPDRRAYRRVGP